MKLDRLTCRALLLLCCVAAPRARAASVSVERVGVTSQGFLFVDYDLENPFAGKALEAIRSGLPSTLTYTIEMWRQRSGWWDKLEETRETRLRVLHDLLSDQYVLVSREQVQQFDSLGPLALAACSHRKEYLRPLSPDKTYYVTITANLAPLSVEDLNELEEWLQGTLRGGEARSGGISGLSGTMVGLLLSLTGFGDETVRGRTSPFVPDEVRRSSVVTEAATPRHPSVPPPPPADPNAGRP